jgi:hypothetical protein
MRRGGLDYGMKRRPAHERFQDPPRHEPGSSWIKLSDMILAMALGALIALILIGSLIIASGAWQ